MNNKPKGSKHAASAKSPEHTGGGTIKPSNEMRKDTTKPVSNRHPYPNGLA